MEDAANGIVAHYERHALAWDADRRAAGWTDKPYIERFLSQLPEGASVLDLGCGGGEPVALHMAARGFRVTGIDSSPTLLSLCRIRMRDQEWIAYDMRSVALGRRFQGILAWDSFFHLRQDDQRMMFEVFAAHAARGAILMFNAGPSRGEAIGCYRGDPLYHASLDASEYQALLIGAGFELIEHAIHDPAKGGRIFWLARGAVSTVADGRAGQARRRRLNAGRLHAVNSFAWTGRDMCPQGDGGGRFHHGAYG